jgi:predicted nuclease of predicted toxin-antitoxin system
MKLLFDQNLSFKLVRLLADLFPGSTQLRLVGLDATDGPLVWDYTIQHDMAIVTQDVDFANLSLLRGHPPKIVWLRCGNQSTLTIERILRANAALLQQFDSDPVLSFIEVFR